MQFSRRALQAALDQIRQHISGDVADGLVQRLNTLGPDRIPACWEAAVLAALSKLGRVEVERALDTGKRPDISFADADGNAFTADITCVSDAGLDDQNPIDALEQEIIKTMRRLRISSSFEIEVDGERQRSKKGVRTRLRLPDRKKIPTFVKEKVEPLLREYAKKPPAAASEFSIEDETHSVRISLVEGPFSGLSYPSYNIPTLLDQNPLYNALRQKARRQLKGASGVRGIVVCDGGCQSLRDAHMTNINPTCGDIVGEFYRQHTSIDFVLVLSPTEKAYQPFVRDNTKWITARLYPRGDLAAPTLETLLSLKDQLPVPIDMPVNAATRSQTPIPRWGNHGGYAEKMKSIKISSRMVAEVLGAHMPVAEMEKISRWGKGGNEVSPNPFARFIQNGQMITRVDVVRSDDTNDDWLEFHFGDNPDPAISPFR